MPEIDPITDFMNIIDTKWNVPTGGTKPTIALTQDYRTLSYKTEYIVLESLSEGDAFNGIGAKDYKRDVSINLHAWSTTDRARARQIVEEVRRILRNRDNWTYGGNTYDNVQMSVTRDLTDDVRKVWHFSWDLTAWHFESV